MKVAVIGSRSIIIDNLEMYMPLNTTEIVSGGAIGVDQSAREYAKLKRLILKEFLPDYKRFKRGAPLKRNLEIIAYSDHVLAFWDGSSKGTKYVIEQCSVLEKPVSIFLVDSEGLISIFPRK